MPQKIFDKNKTVLKELEKTISPILVVNNSSLKPFVELFEYAPENIYQQPLGSLVGFFEVKEYSDESAYIVNFLTSVLKKEYYANPKRPVTESLDSALHKVNLALSELAKQGNVEWLGKIHAAICVIEKNNAHFSVSGSAKIFLHRKKTLSEISQDLASDELEPHPLKTFINVSSGRLEKNDRLLITSEDIFQILSTTEIKKNFERLEGEKFVQFLKTALSNQIEMTASVVVDMTEPVPEIASKPLLRKKPHKTENVFSEKTFANSSKDALLDHAEKPEEIEEVAEETNYTDKKTGHIYIQGEANDGEKNPNSQINLYQDLLKEKISQGIYLTKNEIRKRFSLYKKQLAKKRALRQAEKERLAEIAAEQAKILEEERVLQEIENEQRLAKEKELEKIRLEEERIAEEQQAAKIAEQKKIEEVEEIKNESKEDEDEEVFPETMPGGQELSFKEKLRLARIEQQKNQIVDLRKKTTDITIATPESKIEETEQQFQNESVQDFATESSKITELKDFTSKTLRNSISSAKNLAGTIIAKSKPVWEKIQKQKFSNYFRKIDLSIFAPHFSRIKNLFSRFSKKQRIYTISALALIFVAPLFIVHFLNKPKAPTITELKVETISPAAALANEKNIFLNTEVRNVFSDQDIVTSILAGDKVVLVTKTGVVTVQNGQSKEFQLPSGTDTPTKATYMQDLSLVLILTNNGKIVSFSPISEKFAQNNINLSGVSSKSLIGTYLTYLYVLDQDSNQIYRYPRADGGFGEKTNWLKDSTNLSGVSEMTIDDNIYAVQNNKVLKFFKGKTTSFSLEESSTPINFDKLYTTPDLQFLYTMDTKNSRIVQFNKDGSITAQFYNEQIKDGTSFSVDEKNKLAFITTPNGLISILLQ